MSIARGGLVLVIISLVFILFPRPAHAGGCCYKYFNTSPAEAGTPATFEVAFVDPRDTTVPVSDLANTKINIHVSSPKTGQTCSLNGDHTDTAGAVSGSCTSPTPGTMLVYFSAPDLDQTMNQAIGSVKKAVTFTGEVAAEVAPISKTDISPATETKPIETTVTKLTPQTPTPAPSQQAPSSEEIDQLEQQVQELQEEVNQQKQRINWLEALVTRLTGFFYTLFGRRN